VSGAMMSSDAARGELSGWLLLVTRHWLRSLVTCH